MAGVGRAGPDRWQTLLTPRERGQSASRLRTVAADRNRPGSRADDRLFLEAACRLGGRCCDSRIDNGTAALTYEAERRYLRSVMRALRLEADSQVLGLLEDQRAG